MISKTGLTVIVTAGGTSEGIDDVRTITNNSTGRLGAAITEALMGIKIGEDRNAASRIDKLYYVCGKNAVLPALSELSALPEQTAEAAQDGSVISVIRVGGVDELSETLEGLLTGEHIDAVIHSMAVSDYGVQAAVGISQIEEALLSCLKQHGTGASSEKMAGLLAETVFSLQPGVGIREKKISSDLDHLAILMKRTPKVIGRIKGWSPDTILVGFKLLSGVEQDVLIDTAYRLLQKNDCDLVLGNDLNQIGNGTHRGYLIETDGSFQELGTKEEIARVLSRRALELADLKRQDHIAGKEGGR